MYYVLLLITLKKKVLIFISFFINSFFLYLLFSWILSFSREKKNLPSAWYSSAFLIQVISLELFLSVSLFTSQHQLIQDSYCSVVDLILWHRWITKHFLQPSSDLKSKHNCKNYLRFIHRSRKLPSWGKAKRIAASRVFTVAPVVSFLKNVRTKILSKLH